MPSQPERRYYEQQYQREFHRPALQRYPGPDTLDVVRRPGWRLLFESALGFELQRQPELVCEFGTFPPGLTLYSGGALNGTPTNNGTFNFTVQVNDGSASTNQISR